MRQKLIIAICLAFNSLAANAQWQTIGNTTSQDGILGTLNGWNIDFQTNGATRMSLMRTGTTPINGYNINTSGFLGLSTSPAFFTPAWNMPGTPFALLHLNGENLPDGIPVQLGYRDWMQNGIVFTHNKDFMYVGPRKIGTDQTDATIVWGDNTNGSANGPDNLTFVCTSGAGTGVSGQTSYTGLEIARLTTAGRMGVGTAWSNTFQPHRTLDVINQSNTPQFRITRVRNTNVNSGTNADFMVNNLGHLFINTRFAGNERNFGLGLNGLTDTPTEKLDVNGTARLRNMPSESPKALITGVTQDSDNDFQLNYLSFPEDPGLVLAGNATWVPFNNTACDWNIVGTQNLCMGYVGACNEGEVGIGTDNPSAKLEVIRLSNLANNTGLKMNIGQGTNIFGADLKVTADSQTYDIRGVQVNTQGHANSELNHGVVARSYYGDEVIGLLGIAGGASTLQIGVAGVSGGGTPTLPGIGIYGEGTVAGYFAGPILTNQVALISDEMFKTGIEEFNEGISVIGQLKPKQYFFDTEQYPNNNFSTELQYGFIAQEIQEVIPEIVSEVSKPQIQDPETGEIYSEAQTNLSVNYIALIPILTKAIQEQQEMIGSLQGQVNALAATVASCCAVDAETKSASFDINMETPESSLHQNFPNPFDVSTTISYTVGCACDVQINIYDQSGRLITNLVSGAKEQGKYSVEWNATNISSGIYFYTLVVDGQEFVKRAIKL